MSDTSVTKIDSRFAPTGAMGQKYLAAGIDLSLRLWEDAPPGEPESAARRDYETVGYVIAGRAELDLEGQVVRLEPGDSWVVPKGASHSYKILEPFTAVEATSPPAQIHGRDAAGEERRQPSASAATSPGTASGGPPGDARDLGDVLPGDVRAAAGHAVVPGPDPG